MEGLLLPPLPAVVLPTVSPLRSAKVANPLFAQEPAGSPQLQPQMTRVRLASCCKQNKNKNVVSTLVGRMI